MKTCSECNQSKAYIRHNLCKKCWYTKFPDKYTEHKLRVKDYAKTNNGKFLNAKSHAKARGIEWSLNKEEYVQLMAQNCYYCEDSLPIKGTGLDRKDSSLHYTIDNVVPCCWKCNSIKGEHLSYEEMKFVMKQLKLFKEGKHV